MNWAILRTDALGDTLLTLPLAETIKRQYPQDKVFFVVSKRAQDLFPYIPWVDGHLVVEQKNNFKKTFSESLKFFKENEVRKVIYVGGSSAPVWSSFFAGIAERGGILSRWWSYLLLNRGVRQKRSKNVIHEVLANHALLIPFAIDQRKVSSPRLTCENSAIEQAEKIKNELLAKSKRPAFIMIHPGMSGHSLNWPLANYAHLMNLIESSFPGKFHFLISQTPSDKKFVDEVVYALQNFPEVSYQHFDGSVHGLKVTMALMQKCSLFVAPSTGTTHLANALSVPQISFYGPIKAQHQDRWGPFISHDKNWVYSPQINCPAKVKCWQEKCSFYECMGTITPEKVFQDVSSYLKGI
ncbi:MAG: hypothetical protein Fur0010_06540 [Bdellovibrio sp.]